MPKIKEINVMFLCNGSARLMTCLPIPISRKQFVEAFRVQGREVEIARLNRNWVRVRLPQIVPPPPEPNRNAIDERPINRLSARLLSGAFETTVLFNSYTYLLVFLPLVVSGYYILLPRASCKIIGETGLRWAM